MPLGRSLPRDSEGVSDVDEPSLPMKTLGIVGGIGPESTVEYYRLLLACYREQRPDGHNPAVLINSIDMSRLLALAGKPRSRLDALSTSLVTTPGAHRAKAALDGPPPLP